MIGIGRVKILRRKNCPEGRTMPQAGKLKMTALLTPNGCADLSYRIGTILVILSELKQYI